MGSMKKKGVGVVLTTLLAGLALAPCAFAADGTSLGSDGDFTGSTDANPFSASTAITLDVTVDQIAASVPLSMTVVAKAGGGDLLVPSNYTLKNKSPMDIHVASVTGSLKDATWKFGTTDYASGDDPVSPSVNELTFKLLGGTASPLTLTGAEQTLTGTAWNVAPGSTATPTVLDLGPKGSTARLNSQDSVASALTLTYVIAPGKLTA